MEDIMIRDLDLDNVCLGLTNYREVPFDCYLHFIVFLDSSCDPCNISYREHELFPKNGRENKYLS